MNVDAGESGEAGEEEQEGVRGEEGQAAAGPEGDQAPPIPGPEDVPSGLDQEEGGESAPSTQGEPGTHGPHISVPCVPIHLTAAF